MNNFLKSFIFRIIFPGLILLSAGLSSGFAQHISDDQVVERQRSRWIRSNAREMKRFTPDRCQQPLEHRVVEVGDFYQQSYRLAGRAGCILFPGGDWVYLVSSSSHDNARVGDITLAIDSRGRFYMNEGHVCGGIIHFGTGNKMKVETADHFFEHFKSDIDDIGWESLQRKNNPSSITSN